MPQRNLRTVVLLRGRELADRLRGSLFALPAALVVAGGVLANGVAAVDKAGSAQLPSELRIAPEAAQTLLATIAGATITTTGVVFSIMVVSVQLASGQFSPRVIRGFFRDRNGQVVVGVLVATFAFCVITLYDVSPTSEGATRSPSLGVGIAVVLALASVLLIVRFLDHSARVLYVGNLAERISAETIAVVHVLNRAGRRASEPAPAPTRPPPAQGPCHVVRTPHDGWVQQVSGDGILQAVPPGSTVRLETRPGAYVVAGLPLVTIWPPPPNTRQVDDELVDAVIIGRTRTMQQDVDFGLRQLVDIALRALSPAVNDPTTAIEVVLRLASILQRLLLADLPAPLHPGPAGTLLLRPHYLDHGDYVGHAFDQLRRFAAEHLPVVLVILRSLHMLAETARDTGHPERQPPILRQARLVVGECERVGLLPADLELIRRAAARVEAAAR